MVHIWKYALFSTIMTSSNTNCWSKILQLSENRPSFGPCHGFRTPDSGIACDYSLQISPSNLGCPSLPYLMSLSALSAFLQKLKYFSGFVDLKNSILVFQYEAKTTYLFAQAQAMTKTREIQHMHLLQELFKRNS